MDSTETQEFLEQVNSTQKKLGHNKLQFQIDELQAEIERLKRGDVEKEMKLTLFKKNISTLQTQSQQRLEEITRLKDLLDNNPQVIESKSIQAQLDDTINQKKELQSIIDEKESAISIQSKKNDELNSKNIELESKNSSLQNELDTIKAHLDTLTKDYNDSQNKITELESQVHLKTNNSDSIINELEELRKELITYKSNNQDLQDQLKLKEDQQSSLNIQLQEVENQFHIQMEQQNQQQVSRDIGKNRKQINGRHRKPAVNKK